jgi:hypothetical protein
LAVVNPVIATVSAIFLSHIHPGPAFPYERRAFFSALTTDVKVRYTRGFDNLKRNSSMICLTFGRADAAHAFFSMADGFVQDVPEDPTIVSEGCRDPAKWQRFVKAINAQLPEVVTDSPDNHPMTMLLDDEFAELIKETRDACLDNIDMNPTMECHEHDLTINEKPLRFSDDERNAIGELITAVELTGRERRSRKLGAAVELAYRMLEG